MCTIRKWVAKTPLSCYTVRISIHHFPVYFWRDYLAYRANVVSIYLRMFSVSLGKLPSSLFTPIAFPTLQYRSSRYGARESWNRWNLKVEKVDCNARKPFKRILNLFYCSLKQHFILRYLHFRSLLHIAKTTRQIKFKLCTDTTRSINSRFFFTPSIWWLL